MNDIPRYQPVGRGTATPDKYGDSMNTVREVSSVEDIQRGYSSNASFECVQIVSIEPYGYDERNKWDTHIVMGKLRTIDGLEIFPMGFTSGPLQEEEDE